MCIFIQSGSILFSEPFDRECILKMQNELLPIHRFVQAFNMLADECRDRESLVDSVDEIAMQISNLLTKVGYYSLSKRAFYELMTWQIPAEDCAERRLALTDAVIGLSVNSNEDDTSAYKLNDGYQIDDIFEILYNNRDIEFGTLSSGSDENYFIYPQKKVLSEFLEKGVLIKLLH